MDSASALSQREREIAMLAADGLNCHEIGDRLCLSLGTVKTHLAHIYVKLGVKNRAQLTRFVFENRENHPNG